MPDLFLQVYGLLTTMRIDGVRVNLISVQHFNVYMTFKCISLNGGISCTVIQLLTPQSLLAVEPLLILAIYLKILIFQ